MTDAELDAEAGPRRVKAADLPRPVTIPALVSSRRVY